MTRRDLEKLLGGYAAGTLTEAERRDLFEAALHDQALFSALADEEALREVFDDPACRARVLATLTDEPGRAGFSLRRALARPQVWALAGGLAAACILAVVLVNPLRHPAAPPLQQMAKVARPAPPPAAIPLAAPPVPKEKNAPLEPQRRQFIPAPTAEPLAKMVAPPPAELQARGVAGGVPGGVVGGVLPAPAVPTPPPDLKAGGVAGRVPEGVVSRALPAPPPPPPPAAEVAARPVPRMVMADAVLAAADARSLFYGAPPTRKPVTSGFSATQMAAHKKEAAPPPVPHALGLRYVLEAATLRLEANERAWLYVLAGSRPVFTGLIEPHQPCFVDVPAGGVKIVLARQAQKGDLSNLPVAAPPQLRADKSLNDPAVYVVNPSPAPDARIVATLENR